MFPGTSQTFPEQFGDSLLEPSWRPGEYPGTGISSGATKTSLPPSVVFPFSSLGLNEDGAEVFCCLPGAGGVPEQSD